MTAPHDSALLHPGFEPPLKELQASCYPLPPPIPLAPLPAALQAVSRGVVVEAAGLEINRLEAYGNASGWHSHLTLTRKALQNAQGRRLADEIMPRFLMAGVVSDVLFLGVPRADLSPCWKEAFFAVEEAGGSLPAVGVRVERLIRSLNDFLLHKREELFWLAYELLQRPAKLNPPHVGHVMRGNHFRNLMNERMNP
jgi:hypothetical protein